MTFWLLIRRSLRFHARTHLGVMLGAAIGSAALIGALLVGDSVRGSLRERALGRLRSIEFAMSTGDRFFRQSLAEGLESKDLHKFVQSGPSLVEMGEFNSVRTAALQLAGTAARQDGSARANQVDVLGVDIGNWVQVAHLGVVHGIGPDAVSTHSFFGNARSAQDAETAWRSGETVFLNESLARQLGASVGDEIILRIRKPSQLVQDAVISPKDETSLALRLKVGGILSPDLLGDFSLSANQSTAGNAFLPLNFLASKLDLQGRANLMLNSQFLVWHEPSWWYRQRITIASWFARHGFFNQAAGNNNSFHSLLSVYPETLSPAPSSKALAWLQTRLENNFALEDAQLSVRALEPPEPATEGQYIRPIVEISSSRIFLEPTVASAALKPRTGLLTTHAGFENDSTSDLRFSQFVTNGTPILTYLANLIRDGDRATPYSMITAAGGRFVPADMRDDEILLNEWLADDLQAKTGDAIEVSYYAVDSASHLTERTNSFRVRGVVPRKGIYADRTLMPEFPGVAKAESTQDWDTGFPLVYKIREKDEAYWKRYRGTPKAFITLAAGQAMWGSRFGNLTAIRYEVPTNSFAQTYRNLVYKNLLANLAPAELGFHFEPVREQALRAVDQGQDFGQLFIGFSIFLVVAALLLMALLFQFSLEQRRAEVGTLLALGLRPRQVRRLLLWEGAVLALVGGIVGAITGIAYAKAMLWALLTIWRDAIANSRLHYYASPGSMIIGFSAGVIVAVLTIWLTLRKQARQPARELLSDQPAARKTSAGRVARWVAVLAALAGVSLVGYVIAKGETADAEAFFEAGSLLLIAGLAAASAWLAALEWRTQPQRVSFSSLGVSGCARRRKRSVATIALLASGCFVIVSIGVFRLDANQDANKRSSGTGGFALLGQSTLPVVQDLNTESGREFFGLTAKSLAGVFVVPFRVHEGDEASCLNLNRAQRPRLLGVKPELLADRFSFSEAAKGLGIHRGWNLLKRPQPGAVSLQPDEIPAIGDANSIQWALGKSVGDTLDYIDERGRTFRLRLVAAVANSILQGNLIIDESNFLEKFPGESGYRFFLLDAPLAAVPVVSANLSRALQDAGLELTTTVQRLDSFNAVQNTYLGTFQILGGLGLLLGSVGLGIVVLRNVLERRGELALLLAVGFKKSSVHRLVLAEHGALLGFGLALGIFSAVVAVLPALLSPGRQLPYGSLGLTLAVVLVNGMVWTWLATRVALRGNLVAALRNE
jgi:ABC-type antimicrobial peptide transport system permease subunit